jgi:uncharacterized protein
MTDGPAADAAVRNDEAGSRYEIVVGDELAGYTEYELGEGTITFVHTVVDSAFEGQGLGSRLAKGALSDARDRGLAIDSRCSFMSGYLERHPELLH